jgi:hypothetical protein
MNLEEEEDFFNHRKNDLKRPNIEKKTPSESCLRLSANKLLYAGSLTFAIAHPQCAQIGVRRALLILAPQRRPRRRRGGWGYSQSVLLT